MCCVHPVVFDSTDATVYGVPAVAGLTTSPSELRSAWWLCTQRGRCHGRYTGTTSLNDIYSRAHRDDVHVASHLRICSRKMGMPPANWARCARTRWFGVAKPDSQLGRVALIRAIVFVSRAGRLNGRYGRGAAGLIPRKAPVTWPPAPLCIAGHCPFAATPSTHSPTAQRAAAAVEAPVEPQRGTPQMGKQRELTDRGEGCVWIQVTASASKARCMPSLARSSASLPRKAQWAAVRPSKPRHSFTPRALRQGVFATDVEVSEAAAEVSDEPKVERKPRAPRKEITVQQEEIVEGATFKGTVVRVSSHLPQCPPDVPKNFLHQLAGVARRDRREDDRRQTLRAVRWAGAGVVWSRRLPCRRTAHSLTSVPRTTASCTSPSSLCAPCLGTSLIALAPE